MAPSNAKGKEKKRGGRVGERWGRIK